METLSLVAQGFGVAIQPINLLYCFIGVFIGTLVGVLPGIGPVSAMSLLLPVTLAGTPESGPTALVFRTGCTYRQRLEQLFSEFGWPSATRFELGTLDGMIGCVAADMGVTLLPRAVAERSDLRESISILPLNSSRSRVDTLFVQRRGAHQYSALRGFASCLNNDRVIAA